MSDRSLLFPTWVSASGWYGRILLTCLDSVVIVTHIAVLDVRPILEFAKSQQVM